VRLLTIERDDIETVISNSNAAYIVLLLPIVMAKIVGNVEKMTKVFYLIAFVLALISVVISQSRGAYVLTMLGIILFTVFSNSSKSGKKVTIKKVVFIGIILFLSIPFINTEGLRNNELLSPVIERIEGSRLIGSSGSVDALRGNMLRSISDILSNHPFRGIGFESYPFYSIKHYGVFEFSHNIFLTASEVGVLGVMAWLYIIYVSIYRSLQTYRLSNFKSKNTNLAILISLILATIHALFRPQLQNIIFLTIIAISLIPPKKRLEITEK
jgi:hypothetical protein